MWEQEKPYSNMTQLQEVLQGAKFPPSSGFISKIALAKTSKWVSLTVIKELQEATSRLGSPAFIPRHVIALRLDSNSGVYGLLR